MAQRENLQGKRFGKLVVEKLSHSKNYQRIWLCKCDCGNETYATTNILTRGHKISCGCIKTGEHTRHGLSKTKLYTIYHSMIQGCINPKIERYKYAGQKGITVCAEWLDKNSGLQNFYKWAIENGYKEELNNSKNNNLQLYRKDLSKNYSPENCGWTTLAERCDKINTKKRFITINGTTKTLSAWARENGLPYSTVQRRIDVYHWTIENALSLPKQRKKRKLVHFA